MKDVLLQESLKHVPASDKEKVEGYDVKQSWCTSKWLQRFRQRWALKIGKLQVRDHVTEPELQKQAPGNKKTQNKVVFFIDVVTFVTPFLGSNNDPQIGVTLLILVKKVLKKVTPNLGSQTHIFLFLCPLHVSAQALAVWQWYNYVVIARGNEE